ncbi:sensor histidine kinase [Nocardia sp. CDC159]|uniref:Oxygen sensor histidine kinase NreB n=1 Tax=Nocardia pulmonis TaxID=2951408 RepID=A0A9X2ECQ8_9NOCA|nr:MULTISPECIES: sensor histidine kinase [Nocardia]MCM6778439.1 sensor histidine kinase [Nocardia pulmonis]MCM6791328.1 sensor histidine kinase [Nocardia sp. CDC159]
MNQQPGTDDRFRIRTLRRWYLLCWVLFGLCPPVIAVHDRADATKYGTWALVAVLALSYLILRSFPGNPVVRPSGFLGMLVLVLGVTAILLDGGAAFFIVSLPMFWIHTATARQAIGFLGAAAVATLVGTFTGSPFSPGNVVFTLIGLAGGVLLGLWMDRVIRQGDERARVLGAELARTQSELAVAHRRQGAAEERERLAREIHDTLAQGFASIIVLAEAARGGIDTDPVTSAEQLLSIERTARENLVEARVLVGSAPAGGAASGGIAQSLRRILDRFAEDTGLTVDAQLRDIECDQPTRIALLRCTQESLANVRKHAGAGTVSVTLTGGATGVELEITDDGIGFTPHEARGFGLNGMRTRLAELGGELTVTSSPGEGTRIFAVLPADDRM